MTANAKQDRHDCDVGNGDTVSQTVPMKLVLKIVLGILLAALVLSLGAGVWYFWSKLPKRSGEITLTQLKAPVTVRYDERGVPHISAGNEADLYRALGYVHAQDRLFQMEMVRRLAMGELAEVFGTKMLRIDRLFRTLGIRDHAIQTAARLQAAPRSPALVAQLAYLDGVNQFQSTHPAPLEFDLMGIQKRPFTLQDTLAVSGYLAYSFAAALKTDPLMTFVRDELGPDYLAIFDLDWEPSGVIDPVETTALQSGHPPGHRAWPALAQIAQISAEAQSVAGVPLFEGSNAWAVSGQRTSRGLPLLAGDPHIGFAVPQVWYEAHLSTPGFDLYGYFQTLNAQALLGHNAQFGWTLTLFQNDDMDLIAEKQNPDNPDQVWYQGQWTDMQVRTETIQVKGAKPVTLTLRRSPHGPIITDAIRSEPAESAPIAMWWAFLETDNPLLEAFYQLNRADTLPKARAAARNIHAPGLNVVWASQSGHIGWWAAAKLPIRPLGVNPAFILDGSTPESDKQGFYRFEDNPQTEDPERGYIVSANFQPTSTSGLPIPGYYNPFDRGQALEDRLGNDEILWHTQNTQALQLSTQTAYFWRVLQPLVPDLSEVVRDPLERSLFDSLVLWDGQYTTFNIPPTVFTQFLYELAHAAMADELGDEQFNNLLSTRALDLALPRLAANEDSPWWNNVKTKREESRQDIVRIAWRATMSHLRQTLGNSPSDWGWGHAHTLTHVHPLAAQKPWDWLLNVGPFEMPGTREVPNNQGMPIGPAPWAVTYGPSTRRVIDFANPDQATGINPVGQSGVLFDVHYQDQAAAYAVGGYMPQHLSLDDVTANTRSTLQIQPAASVTSAPKP